METRTDSRDSVTATILSPQSPGREAVVVKEAFIITLRLVGARAAGVKFELTDMAGKPAGAVEARLLRVHGLSTARSTGARGVGSPRWTYFLGLKSRDNAALPPGRYQLHAIPTYRIGIPPTTRGDAINIEVRANAIAPPGAGGVVLDTSTIDYPQPNQQIDVEEQLFFYTTGQCTNPVWSATISNAQITRYSNYAIWVPELGYWVAEFLYLGEDPGPGEYEFRVQASPDPGPVAITIL